MVIMRLKFIMIFCQDPKVSYSADFNEIHFIHDLTDRETTILGMTLRTHTFWKMQRTKNDLTEQEGD